jgi:predicted DNA-binding protein (MmcQ/YjbR family)
MTNLAPTTQSNKRRDQLVAIGRALPEVAATGDPHIGFRVRNKTFAYYEFDHHDDGRISLVCKAPPGLQQGLMESGLARFFYPSYLGTKGWIGLRLDGDEVDWDEVEWLLQTAYRLVAPKRLRALLEEG